METTDYLSRVKIALRVSSDYALASRLGITRSYVSRLQSKHEVMSNKLARQIAEIIGERPGTVVLHAEIERAKRARDDDSIRVWEEIEEGFHAPLLRAKSGMGHRLTR